MSLDVAPPLCEAEGCDQPPLTLFTDGGGEPWWLCEEHGDGLAVGFRTKRPAAKHSDSQSVEQ